MKRFIGTKVLLAVAMALGSYNESRGWTMPEDEDPEREGYRVQYEDGYISWSPKEVFEKSYRETTAMNFGLAVEAMKNGAAVARAGWNGKGMFLYFVPPAEYDAMTDISQSYFGGKKVPYGGYIAMKTAQENVVPWLASQTDILADDWQAINIGPVSEGL